LFFKFKFLQKYKCEFNFVQLPNLKVALPLFLQKEYPRHLSLYVWKIEEQLPFFEKFLLEEEKKQLFAITQHHKKLEFAAARYLAYLICQKFLLCPYKGIDKDKNGKPFLRDISYEISISHCFPYVAIALHKSQSVGVDIEQEQEKLLRVAPRVFSQEEVLLCGESLRKACIIWACKETLYKIYAKKGLIFQTDLLVSNFQESDKAIQAKICTTHYQQNYLLHHEELAAGIHLCCGT